MEPEPQTLTCDECGAKVAPPEGGVCILCLRPFCAKHLASPKGDVGPLCRSCAGGGAG